MLNYEVTHIVFAKVMTKLDSILESMDYLALILFCGPTLTTIHDYWKNHSFDYVDHCWESDVSAF